MSTTTLSVPTISCGHCKSSIEGAVGELAGINRVDVAIESKQVDVDFDEAAIDLATIVQAIEDQGYDVER
ncbi:MAG TPA: copper ion binding protein [Acidimicrobiia bacterium]|nr:copper ion binding protein [Acidimicrobiia bacterium]